MTAALMTVFSLALLFVAMFMSEWCVHCADEDRACRVPDPRTDT